MEDTTGSGLDLLEQHYAHPLCDQTLKALRVDYDALEAQKVEEFWEHERNLRARRWDIPDDHVNPVVPPGPVGNSKEQAMLSHGDVARRRESDDELRMKELHWQKMEEANDAVREGRRRLQVHSELRHGRMKRSAMQGGGQQQQQQSDAQPTLMSFVSWFDILLLLCIIVFFVLKSGACKRFI